MGRINGIDQEDTPPNIIMETPEPRRSESPAINVNPIPESIPDDSNVAVQTVPCSKCERHFTLERIQKHEDICTNTKSRKVYDIVKMRVKGTEAEKLVAEGTTARNMRARNS